MRYGDFISAVLIEEGYKETKLSDTIQTKLPRLMSFNEVCSETTLSRCAINSLRNAGMFPLAVQLGERRIGFVRAEVEAWIDARIHQRVSA